MSDEQTTLHDYAPGESLPELNARTIGQLADLLEDVTEQLGRVAEAGARPEATAHSEAPRLETKAGIVEVETRGGPGDESIDDIRAAHREDVREAVDLASDSNGGYGGVD